MLGTRALSDRNLILTGYIGPNQLAVARDIAAELGVNFVNFEQRVEALARMPVDDIRDQFGEARLKTIETDVLQELVLYRGAVVLISGWTLSRTGQLDRLRQTGSVLCLVASLDAVLSRLHLALGARFHDPSERALALGHLKREWAVRHLPGIREFDTSYLSDEETVAAVAADWQQQVLTGQV